MSRTQKYKKAIDIYKFYNGSSMDKRRNNWERLAKILTKGEMKVTSQHYEPIIHLAQDAAFNFMLRLYHHLTDKMVKHDSTPANDDHKLPFYAKPTASLLMKNTELNRIVDLDRKNMYKMHVLE